jgi:GGDEF domain-containing protein
MICNIGCRFGCDEFAILLPSSTQDEAKEVALRLLQGVYQPVWCIHGAKKIKPLNTNSVLNKVPNR